MWLRPWGGEWGCLHPESLPSHRHQCWDVAARVPCRLELSNAATKITPCNNSQARDLLMGSAQRPSHSGDIRETEKGTETGSERTRGNMRERSVLLGTF